MPAIFRPSCQHVVRPFVGNRAKAWERAPRATHRRPKRRQRRAAPRPRACRPGARSPKHKDCLAATTKCARAGRVRPSARNPQTMVPSAAPARASSLASSLVLPTVSRKISRYAAGSRGADIVIAQRATQRRLRRRRSTGPGSRKKSKVTKAVTTSTPFNSLANGASKLPTGSSKYMTLTTRK